jgi:Cu/Ag efflux protein CusF
MQPSLRQSTAALAASIVLAAGIIVCPPLAAPARAQAAGMAGMGQSEVLSLRATVKAVDLKSRTVTLVGPQGNTMRLKVGDEVRNLPQVKPGHKVVVEYHASIAYVLAPQGTKLPDDSLTTAGVRAAPGQLPAGAIGAKAVVTSTVVGIDPLAHTLQLIDPSGGLIRSVDVVTPEGQQNMKLVKIGDTITAIISEAVAIAVEPVT